MGLLAQGHIPDAERVIEVSDGRLFFPEDRPDALAGPMLAFWDKVLRTATPSTAPAQAAIGRAGAGPM
jgi:hypothetical protein